MEKTGAFFFGMMMGAIVFMLLTGFFGAAPGDVYNNGVRDCMNGRLHPITTIENGDTTVEYKIQWP